MCGGGPERCLLVPRVAHLAPLALGAAPAPCRLLPPLSPTYWLSPHPHQAQVLPLGLCTGCSVARNALPDPPPSPLARLWPCLLLYGSDLFVTARCLLWLLHQTGCTQGWAPFSPHWISQIREQRPPEAQPLPEVPRDGRHHSNPGLTAAHWRLPTPFSLAPSLSPPARCQWLIRGCQGLGCLRGPD